MGRILIVKLFIRLGAACSDKISYSGLVQGIELNEEDEESQDALHRA